MIAFMANDNGNRGVGGEGISNLYSRVSFFRSSAILIPFICFSPIRYDIPTEARTMQVKRMTGKNGNSEKKSLIVTLVALTA